MYFSSGASKKKLDYFLVFFQAYYWFKRGLWGEAFPPPMEHLFRDTLHQLRPKLTLVQSYEEAQKEIEKIRKALDIGNYV